MNESDLLRELSRKTGLPESAAEALLHAARELVHDGVAKATDVLEPEAAAPVPTGPRLTIAAANPADPNLVADLIARARAHPLGLSFLIGGLLTSVAVAFGVHAFTVEAARARLRQEEIPQIEETTIA